MASAPRKRWSRELPPELSELIDTLSKYAQSFIREFDNKKPAMRRIVGELQEISDEIRKELKRLNKHQRRAAITAAGAAGAAAGGAAIAFGLILAPFTGGLSLAATVAGAATAVGGAATATGAGVAVATTAIMKSSKMKESISKVEKLGKEFMEIVEPLKIDLEQIKTTCEELGRISPEVKAKCTLMNMEEFERILRRASELGKKSGVVVGVAATVLGLLGGLLGVLVGVIFATVSREEEEKLLASIMESAEQCQKVVHEFETMKEELTEFI